ncbi:hypothetical protein HN51_064360 [Arachis hypogaea]
MGIHCQMEKSKRSSRDLHLIQESTCQLPVATICMEGEQISAMESDGHKHIQFCLIVMLKDILVTAMIDPYSLI